jgi:putative transposase
MTTTPRIPSYAGYRFPAEVISYAVYLYFRFPLSLRMVEEMLAVRGIEVSHETVRKWGLGPKGNAEGVYFGREIASGIRRRRPQAGDKWHLDEMVVTIAGKKHYLCPALLNLKQCCVDVMAFEIRILASSIEKQLVLDAFMKI